MSQNGLKTGDLECDHRGKKCVIPCESNNF